MAEEKKANELNLSGLAPAEGSRHARKRLGHGSGSGLGKTCGRGMKGQKARSGASIPAGFEGGQMPIHRRLPKRGFTSRMRVRGINTYSIVSLDALAASGEDSFTVDTMRKAGLVSTKPERVKVLGSTAETGSAIDRAITVEADAISAGAREAIEKAGGTVTIRG